MTRTRLLLALDMGKIEKNCNTVLGCGYDAHCLRAGELV